MIQYHFTETNTEIVLTFTGDTEEMLAMLSGGGPLDVGIGITESELDGLMELVTERYDYFAPSDPDDLHWLKVVIDTKGIYASFTFTETEKFPHIVRIIKEAK